MEETKIKKKSVDERARQTHRITEKGLTMCMMCSVTRLGDSLHFVQLFKACGDNYFAQIDHILGPFCKGVKIFYFSSGIIFGQLL